MADVAMLDAEDDVPSLSISAEKVLPRPIHAELIAYEPWTDLIATVSGDQDVDIYRFGGQRVMTKKSNRKNSRVTALAWDHKGRSLAIGFSDGTVELYDVQTGVTSDSESLGYFHGHDGAAITCLGWSSNIINTGEEADGTGSNGESETHRQSWTDQTGTRDPFESLLPESRIKSTSLPQQLALINVENAIPRLSPIAGTALPQFSSQKALDHFLGYDVRPDSKDVDVLVGGTSDGLSRYVVDQIFEKVFRNQGAEIGQISRAIRHCVSPLSSCHAILMATEDHESSVHKRACFSEFHLSIVRIPISSSGSPHAPMIIAKTRALYNLCQYIKHSVDGMAKEWKTHTMLPSRFMASINETLSEKDDGTLEQNLYHLAMTGHCSPTITEWLRDELAERGHKRWDHAMTSLYGSLNSLLRLNMLPALERCTLTASRLRGLATYHEGSKKFDVDPRVFTRIIDTVHCMQLIGYEAAQLLGVEERQFRAFSKWLRHQIDVAAVEPGSTSAMDMAEREAVNMDVPKVLAYLEGALSNSRLRSIICPERKTEEVGVKRPAYTDVCQALKAIKVGRDHWEMALDLSSWDTQLSKLIEAAYGDVQKWQRSTWDEPEIVRAEAIEASEVVDMKMICRQGQKDTIVLAAVPAGSRYTISIQQTALDQPKQKKRASASRVRQTTIHVAETETIEDVKILDDRDLIVLTRSTGTYRLLRFRYRMSDGQLADLSDGEDLEVNIHTFKKSDSFKPSRIFVNGLTGKQVVGVISRDRRQWKIYDLEGHHDSDQRAVIDNSVALSQDNKEYLDATAMG